MASWRLSTTVLQYVVCRRAELAFWSMINRKPRCPFNLGCYSSRWPAIGHNDRPATQRLAFIEADRVGCGQEGGPGLLGIPTVMDEKPRRGSGPESRGGRHRLLARRGRRRQPQSPCPRPREVPLGRSRGQKRAMAGMSGGEARAVDSFSQPNQSRRKGFPRVLSIYLPSLHFRPLQR